MIYGEKLGVFWKIQEICSKMGTRILKIDGEMTEIIEPKVGTPSLNQNIFDQNIIYLKIALLFQNLNFSAISDSIVKIYPYHVGNIL